MGMYLYLFAALKDSFFLVSYKKIKIHDHFIFYQKYDFTYILFQTFLSIYEKYFFIFVKTRIALVPQLAVIDHFILFSFS